MIDKLFGRPYKDNKFLHIFYWFSVIFYFFSSFIFLLSAFISPSLQSWLLFLISIFGFPFFFKVIYSMNIYFDKRLK